MDLDARRLRVLHEVNLRGSVTAAAAVLHVTPSAVSQQLAQLEREAGCDLLERAGRGVVLTHAGTALARHAEDVMRALEGASAGLDAARRVVIGTVRVGSFPSAAGALVAPAAAQARARHPDLDLRVAEVEDDPGLVDLRSTALDVLIVQEYDHVPWQPPEGVERHRLGVDPLYVVTPRTWDCGTGRPADLADRPWVASHEDTPCGRATLQACRDAGFEPDIRHRALEFALLLDLVAAELGVALIAGLGLRHVPDEVVVTPMDRPRLKRTIFAATRAAGLGPRRPAINAFLAELRKVPVPQPRIV
ncbi:MAG TPA: LysR family transcriptional regulator [Jatrophihabitantaceae bacterium]|jgi:DNA-binding transcriptional LysR family regulator